MGVDIPGKSDAIVERKLSIAPFGQGWAVMHGAGYLGHSRDWQEAFRLMQALQASADAGVGRSDPPSPYPAAAAGPARAR